jgi:hypothetical protein
LSNFDVSFTGAGLTGAADTRFYQGSSLYAAQQKNPGVYQKYDDQMRYAAQQGYLSMVDSKEVGQEMAYLIS